MPREAAIKVYRYNELPEPVKKKLRDDYRGEQTELINEFDLKVEFTERLKERGYPTGQIEWSLGYCQGDGVAFYGRIDMEGLAKIATRLNFTDQFTEDDWNALSVTLVRNHYGNHYSHAGTMTVYVEYSGSHSDEKEIEATINRFTTALQDDVRATSSELEKIGYAMLYPDQTNEQIDADIMSLDHEYTIDGRIFNGGEP